MTIQNHISPDLLLQECHVTVKSAVIGGENANWLHPGAPFVVIGNLDPLEAGESIEGALLEVTGVMLMGLMKRIYNNLTILINNEY